MKTTLLVIFGALLFATSSISQQAPNYGNGASAQAPGQPDTSSLGDRVRKLEALTQRQSDVINSLAEEVKTLRADVEDLKKKSVRIND